MTCSLYICVYMIAMTVVVELASRRRVRFQVPGSTSHQEIVATALSHSETPDTDRVTAVKFDDEAMEDAVDGVAVEDLPSAAASTLTTQEAWPPAPRTWGASATTAPPQPKAAPVKSVGADEIRREIESITAQQAAIEEAKYAGRDIDEADEEIQRLEAHKLELQKLLPRKRFLYIF